MLGALAGLGLDISSINSPFVTRKDAPAAGREEATESRVERQQRGKEGEGKEARREIHLGDPTPRAICTVVNAKGLRGGSSNNVGDLSSDWQLRQLCTDSDALQWGGYK
jgi:hypothetical protein